MVTTTLIRAYPGLQETEAGYKFSPLGTTDNFFIIIKIHINSVKRYSHVAWTPPSLPDSIVLLGGYAPFRPTTALTAEIVPGVSIEKRTKSAEDRVQVEMKPVNRLEIRILTISDVMSEKSSILQKSIEKIFNIFCKKRTILGSKIHLSSKRGCGRLSTHQEDIIVG